MRELEVREGKQKYIIRIDVRMLLVASLFIIVFTFFATMAAMNIIYSDAIEPTHVFYENGIYNYTISDACFYASKEKNIKLYNINIGRCKIVDEQQIFLFALTLLIAAAVIAHSLRTIVKPLNYVESTIVKIR